MSMKSVPTKRVPTKIVRSGQRSRRKPDQKPVLGAEQKATNPKDDAATARLDLSLWPDSATAYGALAFSEGHAKYGGYNWRVSGVRASVYVAALRRHLARWWNGEETDPATGVPHLASALACLAVLVEGVEHRNLRDDRPPRQDHAALLARFEIAGRRLQELFARPDSPPRCTEQGAKTAGKPGPGKKIG